MEFNVPCPNNPTVMKKILLLLAAVCTLSFAMSCSTKKEKEQESKDPNAETIDSLRQALTQSQNESNDMIEKLSQIQLKTSRANAPTSRLSSKTWSSFSAP